MSRIIQAAGVLCFLITFYAFSAYARELSIDLSQDTVEITTGFNGASLLLYGVYDGRGDIAVTLEGPPRQMTVRKLERVLGIWMNRSALRFDDTPGYYGYAYTGSETLMEKDFHVEGRIRPAQEESGNAEIFKEALIRNKQAERLFPLAPQKLITIRDGFFKTRFDLPANVPIGQYKVTTYLIQEGKIAETRTTALRVAQVGMSAAIHDFSREHGFLYGVLCVLGAVFIGWLSNTIRNRLR